MNLYWLAQLFGWSFYSLGTLVLVSGRAPIHLALANTFLVGLSGLLVSHCLRRIYKQNALDGNLSKLIGRHFGVILIATVLWEAAIISGLTWIYPQFTLKGLSLFNTLFFFVNYFLTLLIWTLLYRGYHNFIGKQKNQLETMKLELALKEAQLQGLKFQMNPHFLFNALNSIRTLAIDSPTQTREMITRLSSLLRYSLKSDEQKLVSLKAELDIVKHYLAIEQVRFEQRLQVDWQFPETLENVQVLPLSIQTLVENAVKHGIEHRPQGGCITIKVFRKDKDVNIEIMNPGQLPDVIKPSVGFSNTQARLTLQFGPSAKLNLVQQGENVVAQMNFPCSFDLSTVGSSSVD